MAALEGGVDWLQIRDKTASALDLYRFGRRLLPIAARHHAGVLINDRVDVALALPVQGVHLARKSLPADQVRRILGHGQLMGVSVHRLEEAVEAEQEGADYVTFGHVFPTPSKPGLPHRGLEPLRSVVESVNIPVLAIGGIQSTNVSEVLATGCAGVVVISAIERADDVKRAASELKNAMLRCGATPKIPFPERGS